MTRDQNRDDAQRAFVAGYIAQHKRQGVAGDDAVTAFERWWNNPHPALDVCDENKSELLEKRLRRDAWPGSPADRKLAIAVAVDALKAVRTPNPTQGRLWCYFDEVSRAWWAITTDAMVKLADMLSDRPAMVLYSDNENKKIIEAWAESNRTAVMLDKGTCRQLSKEHGR